MPNSFWSEVVRGKHENSFYLPIPLSLPKICYLAGIRRCAFQSVLTLRCLVTVHCIANQTAQIGTPISDVINTPWWCNRHTPGWEFHWISGTPEVSGVYECLTGHPPRWTYSTQYQSETGLGHVTDNFTRLALASLELCYFTGCHAAWCSYIYIR